MLHKESSKYVFITIVLILSTLLAFAFEQLELRRENILLIYIVSIMLIIVETRKVTFGIISTFLLVTIFNFFFTEPKYTFIIDDANYILTLIIFMMSIIILGTLTTSLQKEIYSSQNNAKKIDLLYQMSKELLYANSLEEIVEIELRHLKMNLDRKLLFCLTKKMKTYGDQDIEIDDIKKEIHYAIDNQIICGKDQNKYTTINYVIFPFVSKKDVSGVLIIDTQNSLLEKQEKEFIQTALLHMLTALEREKISEEQENIRIEMERERIKTILLRSISHDLRTPLTTLQTGSSFLFDSYEKLDDKTKKNLLLDINNETSRLAEFVENVLSMTRLQANQLILHPTSELIEDVFNDLQQRVNNRLNQHQLIFQEQSQLDYVYADIPLLIQVLINLIDNAIHHTKDDSIIIVSYMKSKTDIQFMVEDNGGGIPDDHINHIFEDFVASSDFKKGDKLRGIGLGLSICKAIIEAHGGHIDVINNKNNGATFTFNIPILEGKKS